MSVTHGNDVTVTRTVIENPNSCFFKNSNNISEIPSHYNFSSHSTNLLTLNDHLGADDGKIRASGFIEQPLGNSRWNPTPEQLLALEEIYLSGTRTPSAEQIQHIASKLRRFGKIEGKNVFYWFQNHKARERQKRRRREMETNNSVEVKHLNSHCNISAVKKESGLRKTSYDTEQTKNWASSSNYSKHSEEFGPHHEWTQFDERELQQRNNCTSITVTEAEEEVMNSTWQRMEYKKLLKTDHQNLIGFSLLNMKPYQEISFNSNENGETQTLELFPLNSRDDDDGNSIVNRDSNNRVNTIPAINDNNNFTTSTCQYIEFLPLKN